MIGILIYFAIAFTIGFIIYSIPQGFIDEDSFWAGVLGMMVATILWFILWIGSPLTYDYEGREPIETIKITSLKDNQSTSASFFLGSGNVGGSQYYFYMTESEKGKRMAEVSASKSVYINETYTDEPRLEIYEAKHKYPILEFILPDGILSSNEYIFYVPNGTVTEQFDVDME